MSTGTGEWRGVWGCCGGCPCRDEEEGFVSEWVRSRAVDYGRCGIVSQQGSIEWYEGEERARGRGRARKFWEREAQRRGCANGVLATIQGSTTSVDARTDAPGVDGEGRNEVTEARKRDGIKEE